MKNFTEIIEQRERIIANAKHIIILIENLNTLMKSLIDEGNYDAVPAIAVKASNAKAKLTIMLEQNVEYDDAELIFEAQKEQAA